MLIGDSVDRDRAPRQAAPSRRRHPDRGLQLSAARKAAIRPSAEGRIAPSNLQTDSQTEGVSSSCRHGGHRSKSFDTGISCSVTAAIAVATAAPDLASSDRRRTDRHCDKGGRPGGNRQRQIAPRRSHRAATPRMGRAWPGRQAPATIPVHRATRAELINLSSALLTTEFQRACSNAAPSTAIQTENLVTCAASPTGAKL